MLTRGRVWREGSAKDVPEQGFGNPGRQPEAEATHRDASRLGVQKDVGWFQVAVNDTPNPTVIQCARDLAHYADDLRHWESAVHTSVEV